MRFGHIKARLTKDGIRLYEVSEFGGMRTAGRLAADFGSHRRTCDW
jgi:hypothetical protein